MHPSETESLSVELPATMIAKIHAMVDQETYYSPGEIIYEALLDWQRRKEILSEELRKMIEKGVKSDDAGVFDIEEIITEVKAELPEN